MVTVLVNEQAPEVPALRRRLDQFYSSTQDYHDFKDQSDKTDFWEPILARIREILDQQIGCRVLEFGAGRTDFARALGGLRARTRYEVQDVTSANVDYLRAHADEVHVADLKQLAGPFDVVFSTFVWEHITDPNAVLQHLLSILSPGGSLFIACPRYDMPGYVPPSARHYSRGRQLALNAGLVKRRSSHVVRGPA